jgi:DNA-binding transcriptional MerR regulator
MQKSRNPASYLNITLELKVVYRSAMNHYTIGQLAKAADIPISTIRYYERRGLLRPCSRSKGNYRLFDSDTLDRLGFVRSAQIAGFTLSDVTLLLEFHDGNSAPCKEVQVLITSRLDKVVEQIERLKDVDIMLRDWMTVCRNAERSGRCGVIEGLQSTEKKKCNKVQKCP